MIHYISTPCSSLYIYMDLEFLIFYIILIITRIISLALVMPQYLNVQLKFSFQWLSLLTFTQALWFLCMDWCVSVWYINVCVCMCGIYHCVFDFEWDLYLFPWAIGLEMHVLMKNTFYANALIWLASNNSFCNHFSWLSMVHLEWCFYLYKFVFYARVGTFVVQTKFQVLFI